MIPSRRLPTGTVDTDRAPGPGAKGGMLTCDRCGAEAARIVYVWRGRRDAIRLCERCHETPPPARRAGDVEHVHTPRRLAPVAARTRPHPKPTPTP